MTYNNFTIHDYSNAMKNAIENNSNHRLLKTVDDKILFNGFWRNGDKQNICFWPSTATWHDAKTGEGGGCKDFAKIAFGLSLPEFMERFTGTAKIDIKKAIKPVVLTTPIDEI